MAELDALATKFKESQTHTASFDDQVEEAKKDPTMAGFFEQNIRNMDSGTGTIAKKMTQRRPTKKIDGTILSRHKNVVCLVQG